jgi:hypothetical protein
MCIIYNLYSFQSTLEDYESIPVEEYGMAMLRGMGWNPGKDIRRNERYKQIFIYALICISI